MIKRLRTLSLFLFIFCFPLGVFAQDSVNTFSIQNLLNPPAVKNGTDASIEYLQYVFGVVDGVLHGSGSQILGVMFSVFNAAVLVLGVIIVIYTTMLSIVNTANEGEVLGKKYSSVWVPIRSIVGIALLVPKATGYSAIQIFMMWAIVQGIGAADSVWDAALNYLAKGGVIVQQPLSIQGGVGKTASNLFRSQVCMFGIQSLLEKMRQNLQAQGLSPPPVPSLAASVTPITYRSCKGFSSHNTATPKTCVIEMPGDLSQYKRDNVNFDVLRGICGTLTIDNLKEVAVAQSSSSNTSAESSGVGDGSDGDLHNRIKFIAAQQLLLSLEGPAQQFVANNIRPRFDRSTFVQDPKDYLSNKLFLNAAADYEAISFMLQSSGLGISGGGAVEQTGEGGSAAGRNYRGTSLNFVGAFKKMQEEGWIMAGTYYQNLVNMNNQYQSTHFQPPKVGDPGSNIDNVLQNQLGIYSTGDLSNMRLYSSILKNMLLQKTGSNKSILNTFIDTTGTSDSEYAGRLGQTLNTATTLFHQAAGVGSALTASFMPGVGPLLEMVVGFSELASAQRSNANPVVIMAFIGTAMIDFVVELWIVAAISAGVAAGTLGAIPSVTVSNAVTAAIMMLIPIFMAMSGIILVNGFILAFYIPIIPFILFLFGALGWIIAVIEAMVAAPLVAIGITHPEGSEILGKSDPAVLLLVNVFLRPSMMIIGLITGIILSYVGIWFLNKGFFTAFWQSYFANVPMFPFSWMFVLPAMFILYSSLALGIINKSFELINVIPDKVLRWLGAPVEGIAEQARAALGETRGAMETGAKSMSEGAQAGIKARGEAADKYAASQAQAKKTGGAPEQQEVHVSDTSSATSASTSAPSPDTGPGIEPKKK